MVSVCLVAFALCVTLYHLAKVSANAHVQTGYTFTSMVRGLESYNKHLFGPWRTRLFSNLLAAGFTRGTLIDPQQSDRIPRLDAERLAKTVALWTAWWFGLACLAHIWARGRYAILYLLGSFCAVSFAYMPGILFHIFPWDMPALFFFSLATALLIRGKYVPLAVVIPVATGFKETAAVLSLLFLFVEDYPLRKRVYVCAAVLCCSAGVKLAIDWYTDNTLLFTMWTQNYGEPCIKRNLRLIFTLSWLHPVFVNAGTLMVLYLSPSTDRRVTAVKVVAALFTLGNLLFSEIREYRIWFEMIPLSLFAIEQWFYPSLPE